MSIRVGSIVCALSFSLMAEDAGFAPVSTRSVAANRIAEQPDYAHSLGDALTGLHFGLESRTRYEHRWNDYSTPDLLNDDALVARNLLYLAIKGPLDPFRFDLELEDSRRFFSNGADNPNIETGFEFLQAHAQLYFEDALGGQPMSLRLGRMAFDWVDRRLLARNRNRNTISAFDGLRLRLGDEKGPWELDAIAVRPVQRQVGLPDDSTDNATLAGFAGYWRGASPHFVLEPYWLWYDQAEDQGTTLQRDLHTLGLHAFGQWGERSDWDYDVSLVGQWGETQGQRHHAWAAHIEAGHTWATAWKPRLAVWLNYASGDANAEDDRNQRFDPLFGATYAFYGFSSYFIWQNMVNPALRFSFKPASRVQLELMHRAYWLASDTDGWPRGLRRDPVGSSGRFIGQETDLRLVWQLGKNFDVDIAYALFWPGGFVDRTGSAPEGHFAQIAGTLRF